MVKDYKKIVLDLKARKEDRIQAAFQLEHNADDITVDVLGKALLSDPSSIVRHECAFSLGERLDILIKLDLISYRLFRRTKAFLLCMKRYSLWQLLEMQNLYLLLNNIYITLILRLQSLRKLL